MRAPHTRFICGCRKVDNVYFSTCGEHNYEDLLEIEAEAVVAEWREAEFRQVLQEAEDILRIAED